MNTNGTPMLIERKRKRSNRLKVRFCTEPDEVIDTYSQFEYDRSGLFPDFVQPDQADCQCAAVNVNNNNRNNQSNDDNNNNNNNNNNSNSIILTLSFGFVSPSISSCQPQPQPQPQRMASPSPKKNKLEKKRPKLSVDTSTIRDGPLYFTSMSTNHQKREQLFTNDDDHDARITMENTEMNRRCLISAA